MKSRILAILAATVALGAVQPASAAIQWADLTNQSAGIVTGNIGSIVVTYNGPYVFAQTSGGTDYWNTGPVWNTSPATTPPPDSDIIALGDGGLKSITFSQSVTAVYLALNSWNVPGQTDFSSPFTIVGEGCGYWGCGNLLNVTATSFDSFQSGNEIHGILRFSGPITTLFFNDPSENWHGIQIGIESVDGAVPEPSTWAMMIAGFGLMGAALRRKQRTQGTIRFA